MARRPRDPEKHAAIIAAAQHLFLARGFGEVSMDAVAAAAGVSKMTLYGHFRDKDALFEAAVECHVQGVLAEIARVGGGEGPLEEQLVAVGRRFLALLCSPKLVAARRVLGPMLCANPGLARRFYQAGPGQTRASLAAAIAAAAARGELAADDPAAAAEDLLSLWCGMLPELLDWGILDGVSEAEIEARLRRTTAVFLRAYAPDRP